MERTIRVTGKGKLSVKPDTIKLSIEAEGIFEDYGETVRESAAETEIIRNTIEEAGLDPADLKTVTFSVDSHYEGYHDKNGEWKRRFVGYKYNHEMYIKFPNDNRLLGRILYELSVCPAEVEFRIYYTVNDMEAVKNRLLSEAVKDSKAKAEILSEAAGVQLGEIMTIDYSWGELEIYSRTDYDNRLLSEYALEECKERSCDINIEADDIDVQDTVTVVWRIR